MGKSRLQMTLKNIFYGYISTFLSLILSFVSRTIFLRTLGAAYLGVNGLFTNVLGVLSFAELGIGTALNYSLYKPIAENDREKIKSIMRLYKKAYRVIAFVILLIGAALIPFLDYIVKEPGNIGNIRIYYCIFLFNTVSSYFVSYKFSLVNAEQKNYVMTNANTILTIVTHILQIILLLIRQNFYAYLLIAAATALIQKIFLSFYLNKKYPYLLEKDAKPLPDKDIRRLKENVKALLFHKIGEVCVYQTDNVLISAFVNITTVGLISNYTLIITTVTTFVNIIFNSAVGSLGNMIAGEDQKHQHQVFRIYRFVAFWIFGFSSIAFCVLLNPFITLWLGSDMTVSFFVVFLIVLDYYLKGDRICLNNLKVAGGVFVEDRFVSLMQAGINLVVSVIMVRLIGLPGIYVGTVLQGLSANIVRPKLVYRKIFGVSSSVYFAEGFRYFVIVLLAGLLTYAASFIPLGDPILHFILLCVFVTLIPNLIFFLMYRKSAEFAYVKNILKERIPKWINRS